MPSRVNWPNKDSMKNRTTEEDQHKILMLLKQVYHNMEQLVWLEWEDSREWDILDNSDRQCPVRVSWGLMQELTIEMSIIWTNTSIMWIVWIIINNSKTCSKRRGKCKNKCKEWTLTTKLVQVLKHSSRRQQQLSSCLQVLLKHPNWLVRRSNSKSFNSSSVWKWKRKVKNGWRRKVKNHGTINKELILGNSQEEAVINLKPGVEVNPGTITSNGANGTKIGKSQNHNKDLWMNNSIQLGKKNFCKR